MQRTLDELCHMHNCNASASVRDFSPNMPGSVIKIDMNPAMVLAAEWPGIAMIIIATLAHAHASLPSVAGRVNLQDHCSSVSL